MGKENWLEYMMRQKEKLERVLNVDNDNFFKLSHIFLYLCLNDSLFPRLQEYNQFHIYDNVPSTKNFSMWIFAAGMDNVLDV